MSGGLPSVIESFIDTIQNIKKFLLGFSLYGMVLAVVSIGLSVYLMTHEHFFAILDEYNEFGAILAIFLGLVMVVSSIWFAIGIKQYLMLRAWNDKYSNYEMKMQNLEEKIALEFHLSEGEIIQ
jgi:hypothetical protein